MLKSYQDSGMSYRLQNFIYINYGDGLKHGFCRQQELVISVMIYESAQKGGGLALANGHVGDRF